MVGGLHRGGGIHNGAVLQLAVHIAVAGGHGLLTGCAVLHSSGAAGVAEVQAGVDILSVVGDSLRLHTLFVVHAVDHDLAAGCYDVIQRRLGVVVPFKGDAGALQCIGYGAVHQLDRVLLPVGGDADGECALDIQGCKIAAERGVVDLIALFRADAGKVHDLCGGSSGIGHKNLPRTIGVGDVGQPQICSGDAKGSHKAYHHDTKCQHTGRYCLLCGSNCFLQFNGSDTRQLLSLSYLVRPRVLHRHPGRPDCGGWGYKRRTVKYDALFG